MLAEAPPPEPDRVAVPKETSPHTNDTLPVGEVLPEAAFTVAVSTVVALTEMLEGLAEIVVVVAVEVWPLPFHPVTRLVMFAEPRPVAWSYPGPVL